MIKEIKSFILNVILSLLLVFLITTFITRPVRVSGRSMYPTLHDGDYGFSNVLSVKLNDIKRFDIVIIYIKETKEYIVKRVIGLPNETIEYVDNKLFINDKEINQPFLSYDVHTSDFEKITLGKDEYFCMGDNRSVSKDSRFYGPFKKDFIKCKGVYILLPLDRIGK